MFIRCALIEEPLRFTDAGEVFNVLLSVTDGWAFAETSGRTDEAVISVSRSTHGYRIEENGREAFCEESAVSAACSLIVILLNRLVADDPDRLCLHAAAIAIKGQVLVFPSTHRAGKSTLSAALAFRGGRLLADDILPLDCAGNELRAIASGVAPRLRLPLKSSFGWRFRFRAWQSAGPDDGYYRYIRLPPPQRCSFGDRHEPDAFVFLERGTDETQLLAVNHADAMRVLLIQNFGTAAPSDVILDRIARLAQERPAFLLRYGNPGSAASFIEQALGPAASARALWTHLGRAAPDVGHMTAPAMEQTGERSLRERIIRHRDGVVLRQAESSTFLADVTHGGIFALDPLGAAIWDMMREPVSSREIAATVGQIYTNVEPARIAADVEALVETLLARGLIEEEI